jgi:four helix bundle protein
MPKILRFEDLACWQEARELSKCVYRITRERRVCLDLALKDQMQRSAISVISNIAEGKERETASEFVRFLFLAKGSAGELRAQVIVASDIGALSAEEREELAARTLKVSRLLGGLIASLRR